MVSLPCACPSLWGCRQQSRCGSCRCSPSLWPKGQLDNSLQKHQLLKSFSSNRLHSQRLTNLLSVSCRILYVNQHLSHPRTDGLDGKHRLLHHDISHRLNPFRDKTHTSTCSRCRNAARYAFKWQIWCFRDWETSASDELHITYSATSLCKMNPKAIWKTSSL